MSMTEKDKDIFAPEGLTHQVAKQIEDMTLEEIDAMSAEEVTLALKRAELREKAMRLAQLKTEFVKQRGAEEDRKRRKTDMIAYERAERLAKEAKQRSCNHRKGGKGVKALILGKGSDTTDHAIVPHRLPSGTWMLLCLRCGKEEYSYNPLTGQVETPGYASFSELVTNNSPSESTLFIPSNKITIQHDGPIPSQK